MKLWIDEDLSPSLVDVAHAHGLHPGLIVLPTVARTAQRKLLADALVHVDRRTADTGAADSGEFMINGVVEVGDAGTCVDFPLPAGA
jgi:hypothetical protein